METARNKVLEIINENNEKVNSHLQSIQSEIDAMRADFRKLAEKYAQSGAEAGGFMASRGGLYERSDIWIEYIKGLAYIVLVLIIAILMFVPTNIVFAICRCLLRNFIRRSNQLSSNESIVVNSFKLFLLICCVFFSVILYYTFFIFNYLPCKYLLTKGKVHFINIFNMYIPFA